MPSNQLTTSGSKGAKPLSLVRQRAANRASIIDLLKRYKQTQQPALLRSAQNMIWVENPEAAPFTREARRKLWAQTIRAEHAVLKSKIKTATAAISSTLRDIRSSTRDYRAARPEVRYDLVTRANAAIHNLKDNRFPDFNERIERLSQRLRPVKKVPAPAQ